MRKWLPVLLTVTAFALSLAFYSRLPDPMVIHWGADGEPNGWAGRPFGAFLPPVLMAAFTILFRVLPGADPRKDHYEKFWSSYDLIAISVVVLCFAAQAVVLAKALGLPIPLARATALLIGLFYLAIGNVFPRLRSNWWIGIRTPWSLSSEENWARTHRLGGYLIVAAGILLLADAAAPGHWMNRIALGSAIVAPVVAMGFSYAVSLNAEA